MNFKFLNFIAISTLLISLSACSSKKELKPENVPSSVKLPDWIFVDNYQDGISSGQCVKFSGNISLDQQEVLAKGRAAIAQQVSLRAEVMDKTYQDKTETGGNVVTGSSFQSVSRQLTDKVLVGSKTVLTDFGTIEDVKYLCGLVAINKDAAKKVFDNIVKDPDAPKVSAKDEDILYQEFKAYKANLELSDAVKN